LCNVVVMDVGIKIAKSEFSRIIKIVMAGEKVVITSHGKPVARIVPEPVKKKDPKRGAGYLKGIVNLPPGWDSPEADEEFENLFEAVREAKGLPIP
jgi:prevent-host-death family protein